MYTSLRFRKSFFQFDLVELIIKSLLGIAIKELFQTILKSLKNLFKQEKKPEEVQVRTPFDRVKMYMLSNIDQLYMFADYLGSTATMNQKLINVFYKLNIQLLLNWDFSENEISWMAGNFSLHTNCKYELIKKLEAERQNPKRHDSRYLLGFRTTANILDIHKDNMDKSYIQEILNELNPFFQIFEKKSLLNHYALI